MGDKLYTGDKEEEYDYEDAYKEIDDWLRKDECYGRVEKCAGESRKTMVVRGMYVRLDDIDARHVVSAESVETLMVYADVVDVESERVELPGSKQVVVVCRLLRMKARGTVDFKYMIPAPVLRSTVPAPVRSTVRSPVRSTSTICRGSIFARRVIVANREASTGLLTRLGCRICILDSQFRTWNICTQDAGNNITPGFATCKFPAGTRRSENPPMLHVTDSTYNHLRFLLRTSLFALQKALPKICVIPRAAWLHLYWFTPHHAHMIDPIPPQNAYGLISMNEIASRIEQGLLGNDDDPEVTIQAMYNLHRFLKTQCKTIGDVASYDEQLNSMNQIKEVVPTTTCSEVMVIQQMYLLLDDLHVGRFQNPHNVKKLVVLADVIEIASKNLEILSSREVIIICRILRAKRSEKLTFPYISYPSSLYVSPFGLLQQDFTSKVCIYTNELIMNDPFNPHRAYSTSIELPNLGEVLGGPHVLPLIVDSLQRVDYILAYQKSTTIIAMAKDHLHWLISLLNQILKTRANNNIVRFWRDWAMDLSKRIDDVTQHMLSTSEVVDYAQVYKKVNADYAEMYSSVNQIRRVAGETCREVVTMHRMYFLLDELSAGGPIVNQPAAVKEVYVYADVVEVGSDRNLRIPGSTKIIIMCRLLRVKGRHKLTFPYLSHDRGSSPLSLFVSPVKPFDWPSTSGVCIYAQQLIMNNPFDPTACSSKSFQHLSKIPAELLGNPHVLPLIEADLQSAELILTCHTSVTTTVSATKDHLRWLITLLNQAKDHPNLSEVSFQDLLNHAQSILRKSNRSSLLLVPSLRYDEYSELIKTMANAASAYDSEFKQLHLFKEQIRIAGNYLWEQNKKLAEKERDVATFHSSLLEKKKKELSAAKGKSNKLKEQLESLKIELMKAQEDLGAGLERHEDELKMKAIQSVVFLVMSLSLAFTTFGVNIAGYKEAQESIERFQEIKQILVETWNVIKTLQEVMLCLGEKIGKLHDAFDMPEMPSKADWYKFENEIVAVVENLPSKVCEVFVWKAKCKNVAVVSRELITTTAYIRRLEHEIRVENREIEIAAKQAERLQKESGVGGGLIKNYDDEEMALQLDMRAMRILTNLMRVLKLQNGALLYHYSLQPRGLGEERRWWMNMGEVANALRSHEELKLEGLQEQMGTSQPTDKESVYKVSNIPVALLMTGQDWIFTIPAEADDDFSVFPRSWSHVRIKYVEIRFTAGVHHLPSTSSGQVYFLLQASRIFQDRRKGQVLDYEAAVPLEYQFAYDLASGTTTESNKPTHEYAECFMRMTPFTQWRLRLSPSAPENQGLSFPTATQPDSTTDISITFYLTASREKNT